MADGLNTIIEMRALKVETSRIPQLTSSRQENPLPEAVSDDSRIARLQLSRVDMRRPERHWHSPYRVAARICSCRSLCRPFATADSSSSSYPTTAGRHFYPLKVLPDQDADLITIFREQYFNAGVPVVLPRSRFASIPACQRWFKRAPSDGRPLLNGEYLKKHAADAFVPLELTQPLQEAAPAPDEQESISFRRFQAPLGLFLDWVLAAESQQHPQQMSLYLAQCHLVDLPKALQNDFPTPQLVSSVGRGDIYDTNLWIGLAPTYTPLHRDPNPNLFVQLAGRKTVRLIAPIKGMALFASVRRQLGQCGDRSAAAFRGDEMMQGRERVLLEQAVWASNPESADYSDSNPAAGDYCEAHLNAGDGLFIPRGWWHSIKGVGDGVTASVGEFHGEEKRVQRAASQWKSNVDSRLIPRSTGGSAERLPKMLLVLVVGCCSLLAGSNLALSYGRKRQAYSILETSHTVYTTARHNLLEETTALPPPLPRFDGAVKQNAYVSSYHLPRRPSAAQSPSGIVWSDIRRHRIPLPTVSSAVTSVA